MAKRNFSRARGPKSFHSGLQLIQASFGLTQQRIATLLGFTRAAVVMDDRGQRSLPSAAALRLHHLLQQLPTPYGPAPEPPAFPLPLSAEDRDTLDFRRQGIGVEEAPVRKALARCQTRLAQAHLRLQALPALQAAFPDERGQRWLASFAAEAHEILDTDTGQLVQLQLRLKVLAFEAAEIDKLLAGPA